MVKKLALLALLGLSAFASASESGTLSSRAQRSFNAGKYVKGYGQLERALLASRKEADLLSEGRVLIAMAQIRTMNRDLDFADSLLSVVHKEVFDKNTATSFAKAKIAIANTREDYREAAKLCSAANADSVKKSDDNARGAFYAECAIANAGAHNNDKAQEYLKLTGKATDEDSGFYIYTAAQIADLNGQSEADSLYREAETKSIQGNKPFITATILYKRSQLKSTSAEEKDELKARCKNAFELMGLLNSAKRCSE